MLLLSIDIEDIVVKLYRINPNTLLLETIEIIDRDINELRYTIRNERGEIQEISDISLKLYGYGKDIDEAKQRYKNNVMIAIQNLKGKIKCVMRTKYE